MFCQHSTLRPDSLSHDSINDFFWNFNFNNFFWHYVFFNVQKGFFGQSLIRKNDYFAERILFERNFKVFKKKNFSITSHFSQRKREDLGHSLFVTWPYWSRSGRDRARWRRGRCSPERDGLSSWHRCVRRDGPRNVPRTSEKYKYLVKHLSCLRVPWCNG